MIKVFVSGCFDILHGGHVEFFTQARALGDHLTVCLPSDEVLWSYKNRKPSIPLEHKVSILRALSVVDDVVVGDLVDEQGLNFKKTILEVKPDILASNDEDDKFAEYKRDFCNKNNIEFKQLEKTTLHKEVTSTSQILSFIKAPTYRPVRIDFAGGWLDCPENTREDAFIVNCTISPLVSLAEWPYQLKAGLGGSGAYALLTGRSCVETERKFGNGWQDAAVIKETGLCIWRATKDPTLVMKIAPEMLKGKLALLWTGSDHETKNIRNLPRNYEKIAEASIKANCAIVEEDLCQLMEAVSLSYEAQLEEGMSPLPEWEGASYKYCGSGWGGYAVYLFYKTSERDEFVRAHEEAIKVEPYMDDNY